MNDKELDEILLEHKNKLVDHLHAAYHNPSLREDSPQFYIDLHKETVKALQSLLKQAELRGRVEELSRLYLVYGSKDKPASLDNIFSLGNKGETTMTIKNRLATLEAEMDKK